jgi:hypothetical protein
LTLLGKNFLLDFKIGNDEGFNPFEVNSFASIGIKDPFPRDSITLNYSISDTHSNVFTRMTSADSMAYPHIKYINGIIPDMIFLPRLEIMFKIIRACVCVSSPKELWFKNKNIN